MCNYHIRRYVCGHTAAYDPHGMTDLIFHSPCDPLAPLDEVCRHAEITDSYKIDATCLQCMPVMKAWYKDHNGDPVRTRAEEIGDDGSDPLDLPPLKRITPDPALLLLLESQPEPEPQRPKVPRKRKKVVVVQKDMISHNRNVSSVEEAGNDAGGFTALNEDPSASETIEIMTKVPPQPGLEVVIYESADDPAKGSATDIPKPKLSPKKKKPSAATTATKKRTVLASDNDELEGKTDCASGDQPKAKTKASGSKKLKASAVIDKPAKKPKRSTDPNNKPAIKKAAPTKKKQQKDTNTTTTTPPAPNPPPPPPPPLPPITPSSSPEPDDIPSEFHSRPPQSIPKSPQFPSIPPFDKSVDGLYYIYSPVWHELFCTWWYSTTGYSEYIKKVEAGRAYKTWMWGMTMKSDNWEGFGQGTDMNGKLHVVCKGCGQWLIHPAWNRNPSSMQSHLKVCSARKGIEVEMEMEMVKKAQLVEVNDKEENTQEAVITEISDLDTGDLVIMKNG